MRGHAELNRVGSPAGILDGLALAIALFQKTQVVLDIFVGGILALGSHKRRVRAFIIAAQHIRIALVVQNLGRRSKDADRLTIGAISKIKTPQAIIGCGKAEPGLCVARMRLDGAAEMLLGDAVIVRAIILLAETQFVVWVAAEQAGRGWSRAQRRRHRAGGGLIGGLLRLGYFGVRLCGGGLIRWWSGPEQIGKAGGKTVGSAAPRQPEGGDGNDQPSGNSNKHAKALRSRPVTGRRQS